MVLTDAKAALEAWWADKLPKIKAAGGHSVQQALNEQVQRIAMGEAHRLINAHHLSEADGNAIVAHALQHCEPPRVRG